MTITGINHINIRAEQPLLDALRDFYRDALGLTIGYRPPFAGFGYWLYVGDQPLMHLYEAEPGQHRPPGRKVPLDHFAFTCLDRAATERRLADLGVPYVSKFIPVTGHGQIFVEDPAGNRVELQFAESATPLHPAELDHPSSPAKE